MIYIHPDRLAQVVKAHRERPLAVAAYLHGIAVHELTHLDSGRLHASGHDERWVAAREDLGAATAHLLPAIAVLVQRTLGLAEPTSAERKELDRCARSRECAKALVKELQGKVRELQQANEQLRAGGPITTPGTRIRWRTLAEGLAAWRELNRRRVASAAYEARAQHLLALPEALVEASPADQLDELARIRGDDHELGVAGQRAAAHVVRLKDALERARGRRAAATRAAAKVGAPLTPEDVLGRLLGAVRGNLPAGVDERYFDAWVGRTKGELLGVVRGVVGG